MKPLALRISAPVLLGVCFLMSSCVTEKISKNAEREKSSLTMSASTIDRDRASGVVSLHVHARVQQGLKVLSAEHIEIDKKSGTLFANENCVFQNGKSVKRAQAMKFKLKGDNWIEL